jgi:hypothetical protein
MIKGAKSHSDRLKRMAQNAKKSVQTGLVKSAKRIEEDAKASIVAGGGIPSAPGEPPHNQTGALVSGITSGPDKDGGAIVRSNDPASASLEFGRSDARERPFVRPAVQRNLKNIARDVGTEVRIDLKRK